MLAPSRIEATVNRRPSARAASTMTLSVRCTPEERKRWERASFVLGVRLEDAAREAWNLLHVRTAKEEEVVRRWSKR